MRARTAFISDNFVTTMSPGWSPRGVALEGRRRGLSGSSSSMGFPSPEEKAERAGEAELSGAADSARTLRSSEDIRWEKSSISAAK
jgi:hypothetical protein